MVGMVWGVGGDVCRVVKGLTSFRGGRGGVSFDFVLEDFVLGAAVFYFLRNFPISIFLGGIFSGKIFSKKIFSFIRSFNHFFVSIRVRGTANE